MIGEIIRTLESAACVVFDFDGTLVNSNEIKWKGFEHVFAEYANHMPAISAFCRGSNHTVRGDKFKHVTEQILGMEYSAERAALLHDQYARYTTDAVARSAEIPGAAAFVKKTAYLEPALLSSTPHEILIDILDRRGWRDLFTRIQGAPVSKRQWLLQLQSTFGCLPAQVVFFGDTDEDSTSARESGCSFVRIGRDGIPDFLGLL